MQARNRLSALAVAMSVLLAACGGSSSPAEKLLAHAEKVADRWEALTKAIQEIPAGDEAAAKAAEPKIASLYALYAQAIRERSEATWLAGPVSLTIDEKVRDAKVSERLQGIAQSFIGAVQRLNPKQRAAIWTAEVQVSDAQCQRFAEDPWYLRSYALLGECQDSQSLGKVCEWAATMVRLSEEVTLKGLADDIRRVHAAGYEKATWESVASTQQDLLLTTSSIRDKLLDRIDKMQILYKPNAAASTWSDWMKLVKSNCPAEFERLKVCGLKFRP
jgi:hypothetical protein